MNKRPKKLADAVPVPEPQSRARWAALAAIAALVVVFYAVPLTSESAGLQWDAADLHYPFQKYFSDHIRSGHLPEWTPYVYAGYPFLAYPETGAWYPPHWPFFLLGITPRAIQAEVALNAFLACLGAFLLMGTLVESRAAAIVGALCYGLSGFFAGHASHLGISIGAALFPWLLLAFRRAVDGSAVRYTALGGMAGAAMILAGYFQTAMYAFLALGLYAAADLYRAPRRWLRIAAIVAGMLALAIVVASIQVVPTLELLNASFRSTVSFSHTTAGVLEWRALPTLIAANWLGAISDNYTGPFDVTQYYFYAGFLLVPLAAIGLVKSKRRLHALFLIVPAAWFMFGPAAGLYRVALWLPGMNMVREPVQGWFIVALGLAMLAAAGFAWVERRWPVRYLGAIAIAVLFADVWYWNLLENPLAYSRLSFDSSYGAGEAAFESHVAPALPPLTRFEGPQPAPVGPQDFALDIHMENTAGYAALILRPYLAYRSLMGTNPKLRDGLNIGASLKEDLTGLVPNPSVLPRVYFPKSIVDVRDEREATRALATIDPHLQSVATGPHSPIQQDPAATATVLAYDGESYRVRYRAASASLLRFSVPGFPGWHAVVDGKQLAVVPVDLALMGVVVPAGDHELRFFYRSSSFRLGAAITLAGLLLCALLVAAPTLRRRVTAAAG